MWPFVACYQPHHIHILLESLEFSMYFVFGVLLILLNYFFLFLGFFFCIILHLQQTVLSQSQHLRWNLTQSDNLFENDFVSFDVCACFFSCALLIPPAKYAPKNQTYSSTYTFAIEVSSLSYYFPLTLILSLFFVNILLKN